ncbi:MAG: efflux RND transporter periplasmic adaptor subunit [Polyangiaceae bacterium]|nr:efflux RND transporter periplasmic adaptor subunit [Polyangiaceae bacterium]
MRRALAAIASCFIVSAAASCHRGADAPAGAAPQSAAVVKARTAPVAERAMPEYLTVTGTLRANQESSIAADASGKVLQTFVERGQPVRRGQVIATLDARGATLGQTAASAQARLAQSQLEQARRECDRVEHLLKTGAISQADYDRQTSQCTAQQWSAAAAEAQQESATKLVGDSRIQAPFDGIIGERLVSVGQYVEPSTRVATLYEPDPLRLALTVPEASLSAIHPDVRVEFTVAAFGSETFSGAVKYISPNVREASRDLVIEAVVPNAEGKLKPGMFAVAKIELAEHVRPVVPANAVVRDDSENRVFVVGPDRAIQERLVQLGEQKDLAIAVLSGVRAGETVVVEPSPDVRDGIRVE